MAILMNRHGTDKLYLHHYEGEYERHFAPLRDKPINLLEIGIGGFSHQDRGGESLRLWREYFPNATIVGIDIEPKTVPMGDRVTMRVCDQNSAEQLQALNAELGPFDVIIDDGSHYQEHILTSFRALWPFLNPGGIYVIEDLATAYWPEYGGHPHKPPAICLISDFIDGMHHQYWKTLRPGESDPLSVKSVHVSREIVFIYKQ